MLKKLKSGDTKKVSDVTASFVIIVANSKVFRLNDSCSPNGFISWSSCGSINHKEMMS